MASRIVKPFWWYGGKGQLLPKLLPLVPLGGRPYVEPYAGSAALFFARAPAPLEVLNDIDPRVVNFYRVMSNGQKFRLLKSLVQQTPYARAEFARAVQVMHDDQSDDVSRAWAFFVVANQSVLGILHNITRADWGHTRIDSTRGMANPVSSWLRRVEMLDVFASRLSRVRAECIDALQCIRKYDCDGAIFYVDPPFVISTRRQKNKYAHEASDDHHRALVQTLLECKGAVVVSAYAHEIYAPLDEAGWDRVDVANTANLGNRGRANMAASGARIETVWRNERAVQLARALI